MGFLLTLMGACLMTISRLLSALFACEWRKFHFGHGRVHEGQPQRKSSNSYKKKSCDQKEANAIGKAAVKEFIKSAKKAGSQKRKAREPEGHQMESSAV